MTYKLVQEKENGKVTRLFLAVSEVDAYLKFVQQRCRPNTWISYGYSGGTGEYYLTIDTGKCDGCGKCIEPCQAAVLEVGRNDQGQPKTRVKEAVRKKLHLTCTGFNACSAAHPENCHTACPNNAISHTW
jgi:ferredoxin